jgi:putative transposase
MYKTHKIQLIPTNSQKNLLHQSFGVRRHSYNWALAKWKELYELGEKPNVYMLVKLQNSIKKKEFPFYKNVNKCSPQYAIHDLGNAFKKMWKEKSGYPRFKKKGEKDSYIAVESEKDFKQKDNKIWLPRIGWVRCHENLRFNGKVNNVTVKKVADKYFAFVNIITNDTSTICENQAVVGVDLGIKTLLTCSDGKTFENPKSLLRGLKSLKRSQRSLARKKKGSLNRKKQINVVAKKHYKISCMRKNALHQATSYLVKNYGTIVIEDLNVKGMVKNHKLAQAINDASFGEFKRQITYKSEWSGVKLLVADRFFASSKICSCCGQKKEVLKLSERVFKCFNCENKLDRDLNASINLANLALLSNREEVKPVEQTQIFEQSNRVAMNQELNNLITV